MLYFRWSGITISLSPVPLCRGRLTDTQKERGSQLVPQAMGGRRSSCSEQLYLLGIGGSQFQPPNCHAGWNQDVSHTGYTGLQATLIQMCREWKSRRGSEKGGESYFVYVLFFDGILCMVDKKIKTFHYVKYGGIELGCSKYQLRVQYTEIFL